MTSGNPAYSPRPVADASRLWAGGFATALVAALIAVLDHRALDETEPRPGIRTY
jgi:hypothetical protein